MAITTDIQQRVQRIITEQCDVIMERDDLIEGLWVAGVAQQHLVMLGLAGTAKSFVVRNTVAHIDGAKHFETALDENTEPSQVVGPTDVKQFVEHGKSRRVIEGMLPEATHAFIDEILNGNGPVLRLLQPIMNEGLFHDGGLVIPTPLRVVYAGTNTMNVDAKLVPFFDRLHLRYVVGYIRARSNQRKMIAQAVARVARQGRGVAATAADALTKVTVEELDTAHAEAMALEMPDPVWDLFLDVRQELGERGILVGDRRLVEGMIAVLATAWVRGHESVRPNDLDILVNMWWTTQADIATAREVVLGAAAPGEKQGMDLLDALDGIAAELRAASAPEVDDSRKHRAGIEAIRNIQTTIREAERLKGEALTAGHSVNRLTQVGERGNLMLADIQREVFGVPAAISA